MAKMLPGGERRAPQDAETAHLKLLPKDLSYSGQALEKTGRLCLRHPLSAVVFTDVAPRGGVLEVADTSDALGGFARIQAIAERKLRARPARYLQLMPEDFARP